jgi:hypothetical protein
MSKSGSRTVGLPRIIHDIEIGKTEIIGHDEHDVGLACLLHLDLPAGTLRRSLIFRNRNGRLTAARVDL